MNNTGNFPGYKRATFAEVRVGSTFWNGAGPEFGCQFRKTGERSCVGLDRHFKGETLSYAEPAWLVWLPI